MGDKQHPEETDSTIPPALTITREGSTSPEVIETYRELNLVDDHDAKIPHATIHQPEPIHNVLIASDEESTSEQLNGLDSDMQAHQRDDDPAAAIRTEDEDVDEARLAEELRRTTEHNRHIPSPADATKGIPVTKKKQMNLNFDEPTIQILPDRVVIQYMYGQQHKECDEQAMMKKTTTRPEKSRGYLIACDFSAESMSAIEWTMGTMMRDGDEVNLVSAVNDEELLASGRGKSPAKELESVAIALADKSKAILRHMLLYNIKLVAHAVRGRVKDVLMTLIEELPLTMVVCGSRGRSTMQGLLMGSVSTYILQKSPVPVSVIRYQKKRTKSHSAKQAHAQPLSESVKTGHLIVDELSGIAKAK